MLCIVFAACSREEQATSVETPPLSEQLAQGSQIYSQSCAICHYDGAGNPVAADLKGSAVVSGPPQQVINVILHGQGGVSMVNGKKLNGQMPKMNYFSDQEVAAVTAYVRSSFGGPQEAVSPALVGPLRK